MSLNPDKLKLIDYAMEEYGITSFAELGCAWGVDGGYGFHILDHYEVARAVQVDMAPTETMKEKAPNYPQLQLIERNFCDEDVPKLVGDVDVVILFDVLLHQVKPDWDELLKMYAPQTKHFLIYNQQWISSAHTVRLIDFGQEEYFKKIPAGSENYESYAGLFDRLDQAIPSKPERLFRDIITIWQWGITDSDLIGQMKHLGFRLDHYRNCGQFCECPNFENHAFAFSR